MIQEIGSNFYNFEFSDNIENIWWWETTFNFQYFKSGRNAIKALARLLKKTSKRVLLPDYTCETVIEPFLDEGWEYDFYSITTDLSIDYTVFKKQIKFFKPSLILIHDYFGIPHKNKKELFNLAHRLNCLVVEDLTSCFLNPFVDNGADYYLASFRKFFAIPDGGVLASKKTKICFDIEDCDEKLEKIAIEACKLKQKYFDKNDKDIKEQFRDKYKELQKELAFNSKLISASPKSIEIIKGLEIDKIKKKRRQNYMYLLNILKRISFVHPVYSELGKTDVPLFMPVIIDCSRKELQDFLAEYGIYCPIIWPKSKYITTYFASSFYLYEHMLCIPIDQRYGEKDMLYICERFKEWNK